MKIKVQYWFSRLFSVLDDDINYFAASLSFYTVLSIIPMLWVLFFILNRSGVFDGYFLLVQQFLVDSLIPSQAELITGYLKEFMSNAGKMGSLGLMYIVITSLLFYRNYQYVVNKIFLMPNYSLLHTIGTYLILAFLMPVTLGASFYLSEVIQNVLGKEYLSIGQFSILPFIMIWMLFFVLYKVSPNMKISFRVAIKVSLGVSIIWHVAKWLFVEYTLMNQAHTSLYGSFSALLFLLIWVYLSWLLLLHGLKACYLMQCHYHKYD